MPAHGEALTSIPAINVSKWFEGSKFNAFHLLLFFLGVGVFTFDGYDLFVYGAAVPLLLKSFHISLAQAGAIASYAPIGAAVGALIFGSLADKIGRKTTILICAAIFCAGMGLSGIASGPNSFGFFRFITGFGVGGTMPNMVALCTEYAPARARSTMVALMLSGIQVGGILASVLGMTLFPHFGWRSVFLAGFVPIIALPLYMKLLPESPVHLVKRNRLEQLRNFVRKARPSESVPDGAVLQVNQGSGKAPIATIFQEGRAFSTVVFWCVYFLNLYTIFGFTIWLPKLIINQGFSLVSGLTGLLILSIASIIGSYVAGFIADRIGSRPTLCLFYFISFASIVLTGYMTQFVYLMLLVSLAGAGFNGAQNIMNAYIGSYYPPSMRSTAMGFAYGLGRLGAIFGPAIVGLLMTLHFSYRGTLVTIGLPGLIAAVGVLAIREKYNFARQTASEKAVVRSA
jgi:AAHS family benzoate transporter-like MFS transporter